MRRFCEQALRPAARAAWATSLVCILALAGCSTPDLKPFADASRAASTGVNAGGDLAIQPLTRMTLWDGTTFVPPSDPNHASKEILKSWEIRRKAMDAVLVYSASLVAINEASARRKANATELVDSVKQLAGAVPGIDVVTNAAGDLTVTTIATTVEVKAYRDMRKAVEAADPAIQEIAKVLKQDFVELSNLFESPLLNESIQVSGSLRPVKMVYEKLQDRREQQRKAVAEDPCNPTLGNELARLDALSAAVEQDLNRFRTEKARIEESLADGKAVFAATIATIDAWASAHTDLVKSLEQNRAPNLVLLVARAEELKEIVDRVRQ
jgi:hypothetical protein